MTYTHMGLMKDLYQIFFVCNDFDLRIGRIDVYYWAIFLFDFRWPQVNYLLIIIPRYFTSEKI